MIAFVDGILESVYEDRAVIDINGLGFNVFISNMTMSLLPSVGSKIRLYTYTSVREDAFLLYGFLSRDELNLFRKLISVNGVGPKGGLSILSLGSSEDIRFAILSGDTKLISAASGIGKKTAERIVLELHDKLSYNEEMISREIGKGAATLNSMGTTSNQKEAAAALVALGYSSAEANKAVMEAGSDANDDVEDILKKALKVIL